MSDKPVTHQTLRQKINNALDIPDISKHASLLSLRGRNEFSFSGASTILSYTPEEIRLSISSLSVLCVKGSDLICTAYHKNEMKIFGRIDHISFTDETITSEKTDKNGKSN